MVGEPAGSLELFPLKLSEALFQQLESTANHCITNNITNGDVFFKVTMHKGCSKK